MTLSKKLVSSNAQLTTDVKKFSKLDHALLIEAYTSGGHVNIFDLLDVIGRKIVLANPIVKNVIEGLRPGQQVESGVDNDKF